MENKTRQDAVRLAHFKGYRVMDGVAYNSNGRARTATLTGRKRCQYLAFSLYTPNGAVPVPIHRLVAFQKFGDLVFEPGTVVRHRDGNPLNNLEDNVLIGTISQNAMDRPEQARKEHAAKGAQKHSDALIAEIRHDHQSGLGYKKLRAKYGLPLSTLSYYLSDTAKRTTFTFKI